MFFTLSRRKYGGKLFTGHPSFQTVESTPRRTSPLGFGLVEMSSAEAAQKAIEMFNGKPFMERSLTVSEAKSQSSRRPSGDGGGRRE